MRLELVSLEGEGKELENDGSRRGGGGGGGGGSKFLFTFLFFLNCEKKVGAMEVNDRTYTRTYK